jgi:hypothetical protein
MIYKTLHRKPKIEQHEPYLKPWMTSGDSEGYALPASLEAPVLKHVLL